MKVREERKKVLDIKNGLSQYFTVLFYYENYFAYYVLIE